ncbi:unnamed protein product, partial [Clonostachys rhizophaga]
MNLSSSQKGGPNLITDKKNKPAQEVLDKCEEAWDGKGSLGESEERVHSKHMNYNRCGEYLGMYVMNKEERGKQPGADTQMVAAHRPNQTSEQKEASRLKDHERSPATKSEIEIQAPCDDANGTQGGCATIEKVTGAKVVAGDDKDYDLGETKGKHEFLGRYEADEEYIQRKEEDR